MNGVPIFISLTIEKYMMVLLRRPIHINEIRNFPRALCHDFN